MDKKEIFKLIEENSYMKYCICKLLENIKENREFKDLKKYLEQILVPDNKSGSVEQYRKIDEFLNRKEDK